MYKDQIDWCGTTQCPCTTSGKKSTGFAWSMHAKKERSFFTLIILTSNIPNWGDFFDTRHIEIPARVRNKAEKKKKGLFYLLTNVRIISGRYRSIGYRWRRLPQSEIRYEFPICCAFDGIPIRAIGFILLFRLSRTKEGKHICSLWKCAKIFLQSWWKWK